MPTETVVQNTSPPEFENAVTDALIAIDNIWENADGLTLGDLRKAFVQIREKTDYYISEIGH